MVLDQHQFSRVELAYEIIMSVELIGKIPRAFIK